MVSSRSSGGTYHSDPGLQRSWTSRPLERSQCMFAPSCMSAQSRLTWISELPLVSEYAILSVSGATDSLHQSRGHEPEG